MRSDMFRNYPLTFFQKLGWWDALLEDERQEVRRYLSAPDVDQEECMALFALNEAEYQWVVKHLEG